MLGHSHGELYKNEVAGLMKEKKCGYKEDSIIFRMASLLPSHSQIPKKEHQMIILKKEHQMIILGKEVTRPVIYDRCRMSGFMPRACPNDILLSASKFAFKTTFAYIRSIWRVPQDKVFYSLLARKVLRARKGMVAPRFATFHCGEAIVRIAPSSG